MRSFTIVGGVAAVGIAGVGLGATVLLSSCSDPQNTTELSPEGPPEIMQVFVVERVMNGAAVSTGPQLAFGSHPDLADDDGEVVTAVARSGQRIRIVFDELLRGNDIEEVACADGSWSRIPEGTDPDELAACAGAVETLNNCDVDVCVGADGPVGVLDETGTIANEPDGAPDDLRMMDDAVTITCDGTEIPWDQQQSFFQPSGNQQITAGPLGINSLGPAIIIAPTQGLRTGAECSIALKAEIVDKDGNRPCAPVGDSCTPGDLSAIKFRVEGLNVAGTAPSNGQTNVALADNTGNASLLVQFNAAIDPDSIAGITLADESGAFPACADANDTDCVRGSVNMNDATIVTIEVDGGYTAENMHTVTVPTTVTDIFGGALPAEYSFSFTTRAETPMVDAGMADAGADAGDGGN